MLGATLVTGAQGFVGRYVTAALLQDGCPLVVGLGRSEQILNSFTHTIVVGGAAVPAPLPADLRKALLNPRYEYRKAALNNILSLRRVLHEVKPDVIVHLAAARREESAVHLIEGNISGVCTLIEACRGMQPPVKKLILGSSAGVYGTNLDLPMNEELLGSPNTPYGFAKLASEYCARTLCEAQGIELVVARIFNVVGPGQDERHICGKVIHAFAAADNSAARATLQLGSLDGYRDLIDVRDVAAAISVLASSGIGGVVYNVATGQRTRMATIVEQTVSAAGNAVNIDINPTVDNRNVVDCCVADIQRIRALGWAPQYDLPTSIADALGYYRLHLKCDSSEHGVR